MTNDKNEELLGEFNAYKSFDQTMRPMVHPSESDDPLMDMENAEEFLRYAKLLDRGRVNFRSVQWDKVKLVNTSVSMAEVDEPRDSPVCVKHSTIPKCPEDPNLTHELLNKLAVLKLNGGLGTTMGCKGSKSAIEVRDGLTFLDMTVRQVEFLNSKYGVDVPLIFMNSFNTHLETERLTAMYKHHNLNIRSFEQHCFPKISKKTLQPLPEEAFTDETSHLWYPPGHGDVYAALSDSGVLEELVNQGKEYIFLSNIDNLGAVVDLDILYELMCSDRTFAMEVTPRERQDKSGGILVDYAGQMKVLEHASLPKNMREHYSAKNEMMFNTNNIWINLRNLQRLLSTKPLDLEVLVRERPVVVGEEGAGETTKCLKLQTAIGGGIEYFDSPIAIHVSRHRFLPVKTTSDLFAVQSNIFAVKNGTMTLRPERVLTPPVPTVKLGQIFQSVEAYQKRLLQGVPDILELEHLTVSGDVHFGKGVVLKGTVIIVSEGGAHIDIADGSVLQDSVITGNLRIMEH